MPDDRLLDDGLLTVPQAARLLASSRSTLYQLMTSGQLPFVKVGASRRISRRALLAYVERHTVGGQNLRKEVGALPDAG
jgi:excisionase family DNA binding protein